MIYLCTKQQQLFESDKYTIISTEAALNMLSSWGVVQYDSETSGRDARICNLLCVQFGNDTADVRVVVDCTTCDILLFKEILETKLLIGHNLKFDLQFLYNYGIVPRHIYDTMIVEQLLHLGYPSWAISYSLKETAHRRLHQDIDKSIRGQIMWRGLDESVVVYAAGDVTFLEKIMAQQVKECTGKACLKAAKLECDFVPVIAYMEWCGIKLDVDKWKAKMQKDKDNLQEAIETLNNYVVSLYEKNPEKFKRFVSINYQGDLFEGFDLSPKCNILWSSSAQVIPFAKALGFDTTVQDKKTGEDKDSVLEKHLKKQKGIDDVFLRYYFGKGDPDDDNYYAGYTGSAKVVSSFGQGHIDAINPVTGRIHTNYKQLGADTGRMSCGSDEPNTELAKYKKMPPKKVKYPNMQQLPHDKTTRACFVSEPGNLWVSCDYSAIESRLGADVYGEKAMIEEFLHGSGDMHSLCAFMIYKNEIPRDTPIKDIRNLYPHLRTAVKPIEFENYLY